jgi:pimeloyl-ACP methyl ester carboxylesterase
MSRSRIALSNGVTLSVVDDGEGAPVIFQHGLGAEAAQVAEVFPAEPPTRRITLECRGHGGSDMGSPAELTIATFAADLAGLADRLGVRRGVVGGISMGAAVSLRLAVRRPDLVGALILARPAWLFDDAPETLKPYALVGDLLKQADREAARDAFRRTETAKRLAAEAPDNLVALLGFFDRPAAGATSALLMSIAADGPGVSEAEVRAIAVPTLVIGNGEDLVHPLAYARRLAATIPNARLVEITSKTVSRARYVREFRSALSEFLREVLPVTPRPSTAAPPSA